MSCAMQTYDMLCAGSDSEADDADASEGDVDTPPREHGANAAVISVADSDEEFYEVDGDHSVGSAQAKPATGTPAAAGAGARRRAAASPQPHKEQVCIGAREIVMMADTLQAVTAHSAPQQSVMPLQHESLDACGRWVLRRRRTSWRGATTGT